MDKTSAINAIRSLHFMPTWNFDAYDMFNGTLMAVATWETVNSDREQAAKGYPETVNLERMAMVQPENFDTAEELHAAMFTWLLEIQIHESREFFRVGEGFRAPFHPHRPEGDRNWSQMMSDPTHNPMVGLLPLGL